MDHILEETEEDQEYQRDMLEGEGVLVCLDMCPRCIGLFFARLHIPPLGLEYRRIYIHHSHCNVRRH